MSFYHRGKTINSDFYCQHLMRLKEEVEKNQSELINRKSVVFHHDNARQHTPSATPEILREFGWKISMHPPFSPELAPSDFHLFRSLQISSSNVRLTSKEDSQNYLSQFFDQKSQNFYSSG
ncbi:Histone-lysine N-methyltransferase SETMAR [Eumeta japonica]|uniref:Histone-lysine N-methyltransferase SETMAR n=1 Tax=Eumeta variegata TaxID=151549 RepID=A0A4C1TGM1_EUMVA|nr:Histone-lysine N-methyltransferase SETMAR [Eumeta japonica]